MKPRSDRSAVGTIYVYLVAEVLAEAVRAACLGTNHQLPAWSLAALRAA
jgi:hypothetical protein